MASESQIPAAPQVDAKRFAARLGAFYGTMFGMLGTYLPFFPLWLKAVGIEASWIGIITAVPAVTRFTVLPLITSLAERRRMLRGAIMITAAATAFGFALIGTQRQALPVFLVFVVTCCLWTPTGPLTDAYALRGVTHYRLNYGPLRLWGSAAFVVGALLCGLLVDEVAAEHLIWIIAAVAGVSALTSLGLRPLEVAKRAETAQRGGVALLRDRGFLAIIAASALIQGSHVAYYIFASIVWKQAGLGGLTIAALWSLGVLAEIVLFAVSPRLTLPPAMLVVIGALAGVARWVITAQDPPLPVLAVVQLAHGLTFGLTQVGIMGLLVHQVPGHIMARGQGYLAACSGIVSSSTAILCGVVYARYGQGVYYLMAAMAASGALVMWLARRNLHHPQSAASGG
ncbi:MFS transporter [Bradyrhizobium neotropicale]|uniref:MFS transporter n=1 Tax=Bradyrhizobium neotropicale TaxID=1497615 RepID=UPI001AD7E514|nr:MFS transporter [Bradyrhizobium neotropicale]MBO4227024.1 MFS transporter [Bradyrhizobium neotropicale]